MTSPMVAIFVTARMGSTRLPGKHMLKLEGKPVIEHLVDRIKLTKGLYKIILCTTTSKEDNVLEEEAERLGILCFRGHRVDILKRWLDAANLYDIDFIISAEGDDVFCDPKYIDDVVACYLKTHSDYITCSGLPFGVTPKGIKVTALKTVCDFKTNTNTEGQSRYFTQTGRFHVTQLSPEIEDSFHSDIRMTLDYKEDFEFFKRVFHDLYEEHTVFSLKKILDHLDKHPSIIRINQHMQKEYAKRSAELYPPLENT